MRAITHGATSIGSLDRLSTIVLCNGRSRKSLLISAFRHKSPFLKRQSADLHHHQLSARRTSSYFSFVWSLLVIGSYITWLLLICQQKKANFIFLTPFDNTRKQPTMGCLNQNKKTFFRTKISFTSFSVLYYSCHSI